MSRARTLTELHRAAEAGPQIERAASLLGETGDLSLRGDVAAAEARALWTQRKPKTAAQTQIAVQAAVKRARALYAQAGQRSKRDAVELENWITEEKISL